MNYCNVSAALDSAPVGTLTIRALVIAVKHGATTEKRTAVASSHKGITLGTAQDYVKAHRDALLVEGMDHLNYWYEWQANPVAMR